MIRRLLHFAVVVAFVPPTAFAQVERYDTGQKLIAFEQAWDDHPAADARKRTLPPLKKAVATFFAGRFTESARSLDEARHLLASAEPPAAAVRWADALVTRPAARLLDTAAEALDVQLTTLYDPKADPPVQSFWRLKLVKGDGTALAQSGEVGIDRLPLAVSLRLNRPAEGDCTLVGEIVVGDEVVATHRHPVAVAAKLGDRLESLRTAAALDGAVTTERLTLRALSRLLSPLASGYVAETGYPAGRLLAEAEALVRLRAGQRYYGAQRGGQYWLTLATTTGPAPIRLFVPDAAAMGRPLPLVIALHGAGGSENLFFDAYGHGEVVRQCEKRGWLLVATRATGFIGLPPTTAIIDELATRYPVDPKRVYLIGHSMGAGHATALAQRDPGRYAAVAALGGGARVGKPDALQSIPFFIGCGTEDFIIGGARALHKSLQGATQVRFQEYPDIEHIVIVQAALGDVFKWFEEQPRD